MKKSFYLKYLEQQRDSEKNKIKKSDVEARGSDFFMPKILNKLSKILYYIFLSVLISIGLTVLLNPSIREIFINLFRGGL